MKAVILHGTEGSPEANWFQWLKKELEKRGHEVWLPELPNANNPSLREWTSFILDYRPFEFDNQTILIGHSSGAIAVLTTLQRINAVIAAGICVAPFKDNEYLKWEANNRLFDMAFDFEKIKAGAGKLIYIYSDNDPYVPKEHVEYFANKTSGELIMLAGQKHFNLEAGEKYSRFPKLLEIIEQKVI